MSVEGYLNIRIRQWRMALFNSKKAAIVSLSIFVIFFCSDFYLTFVSDNKTTINNQTMETTCVSNANVIDLYLTV
jgi:hypothetical protein